MTCFPVIFVEKLTLIRSNKIFCGSKTLDHPHPHPHPHPNHPKTFSDSLEKGTLKDYPLIIELLK